MSPLSSWYHVRLWAFRYLRWRDFVQALLLLSALYFLVLTYFAHHRIAIVAGSIYLILFLVIGADVVRGRKAKDFGQAELLRAFFSQMNQEVFNGDESARFTLFRPSPFDKNHLVAWYRYKKGGQDIISEALRSKANYGQGEGFTGNAWLNTCELTCASLPVFSDHSDLERHYVNNLRVSATTAKNISEAMMNVRTILSFGFESAGGDFLGVLSIDLATPITITDEDPFPRIGEKHLYADVMTQNLSSIGTVLECFARAEI